MTNKKNIYDQRQYRIMLGKIKYFFLNKLDANSVILDLEALIDLLHFKDECFMEKFEDLFLDIDIDIYYCNEGHIGNDKLIEEDKNRIKDNMIKIQKIIESKIDKSLSDRDAEYKY